MHAAALEASASAAWERIGERDEWDRRPWIRLGLDWDWEDGEDGKVVKVVKGGSEEREDEMT